jgi:hypothetical protein
MVIGVLGLVLILAVSGIIFLAAATTSSIPDVLQNIAVGALTALGALLVPSRSQPGA